MATKKKTTRRKSTAKKSSSSKKRRSSTTGSSVRRSSGYSHKKARTTKNWRTNAQTKIANDVAELAGEAARRAVARVLGLLKS